MTKTAHQVIAEELNEWTPTEEGIQEHATRIVAALDRHGYRIIRHRVVRDGDPKAE